MAEGKKTIKSSDSYCLTTKKRKSCVKHLAVVHSRIASYFSHRPLGSHGHHLKNNPVLQRGVTLPFSSFENGRVNCCCQRGCDSDVKFYWKTCKEQKVYVVILCYE